MIGNTFQFSGQFDLVKSTGAGNQAAGVIIRGRVLNAVKDATGETPIVPEMDWSLFDKQGFIKDEHTPVTLLFDKAGRTIGQRTEEDPSRIIGVPIKRIVDGNQVFLEAALFPNNERTQKYVDLIRSFEAHNKAHPSAQRHVGFSIEGSYTKRLAGGKYAGVVHNIAITPKPTDSTTYAEIVTMAKSMMAGYGTSPEDMNGGGALRRENLQGATTHHTKSQSERKSMYKDKNECYLDNLKKGLTPEKAKEAAEAWEREQAEKKAAFTGEMEKAIVGASESFSKSIQMMNELGAGIGVHAEESAGHFDSLKKSITGGEDGSPDGFQFLTEQGDLLKGMDDFQQASNEKISKSIAALAEGMNHIVALVKSIGTTQSETQQFVESLNSDVRGVVRGMQKSGAGRTIENLDAFPVEAEQGKDILKSLSIRSAQDFLNQRIAETDGTQAQQSYQSAFDMVSSSRSYNGLNKAIVTELETQFKK